MFQEVAVPQCLPKRALSYALAIGMSCVAVAQQTGASMQFINAAETSTAGSGTHRAGDVVNVKDFGAKGDGLNDDAAAINAAVAYLRGLRGTGEPAGHLVFPQGRYIVESTINLTRLNSRYIVIDGAGAVLVGRTEGKPVVDALGTRYLRIRDLSIEGDAIRVPSIGIQIGRIDTTVRDSSDNITLDEIFVSGSFSFTALYNLNAETSMFTRVNLWNSYPAANSYALVQDGLNHWRAHSDFVAENAPTDTPQSFNENLFISADIRHFGGGTPIWMAQTSRHQFINSYTANTKGTNAVMLYSINSTDQNLMLDLDMHIETSSVSDALLLTGPNANPVLFGLRLRDHYSFATRSLFRADTGIKSISLQAARIEIGGFASPSARVFAQPALWSGSADVVLKSPIYWNGSSALSAIVTAGGTISFMPPKDLSTGIPRLVVPPPVSNSDTCEVGQISVDDTHVYVCTAGSKWKRAELNAW
jgi:hypothetical protein